MGILENKGEGEREREEKREEREGEEERGGGRRVDKEKRRKLRVVEGKFERFR